MLKQLIQFKSLTAEYTKILSILKSSTVGGFSYFHSVGLISVEKVKKQAREREPLVVGLWPLLFILYICIYVSMPLCVFWWICE